MTPCNLGLRGVLVTRPAHQAEPLCQLIEAANGRPERFPTIVIEPTHDERARLLLAERWDLIYFVSPNAVAQALALVDGSTWANAGRVAAVGHGTALALKAAGRAPDLVPNGRFQSEELLAMPELAHLDGQRVLVVRGRGGRALMGETLTERGATVHFAEVYQRTRPQVDPAPLLERWQRDIDLVTVTSTEILLNLIDMLGGSGRDPLLNTPLVVIAERTQAHARELGFRHVELADRAADADVLAALCRCPSSIIA